MSFNSALFRPGRILLVALGAIILVAGPVHAGKEHDHHAERLKAGAEKLAARETYVDQCAACHGPHGAGGRGALRDFTAPSALVELTRETMIQAVHEDHAGMTSSILTPDEVAAVVDYIRESLMLPAPAVDASIGRTIYSRSCSVCHGDRGNAASWAMNSLNPPPVDFTSAKAQGMSREQMIHSVTFGVPDTAMMPFATQLNAEEIAATVGFIRETFTDSPAARAHRKIAKAPEADAHEAHGHSSGSDINAPMPAGLVGDAEAGGTFFKQTCAECHGENGDGQGRRAYFMLKKPADLTSARARVNLNRPHLFEATAKGIVGSPMPAWSKVLTAQQIADVTEYVFTAFIQPDAAGESTVHNDHSHKDGSEANHHQETNPVKKKH